MIANVTPPQLPGQLNKTKKAKERQKGREGTPPGLAPRPPRPLVSLLPVLAWSRVPVVRHAELAARHSIEETRNAGVKEVERSPVNKKEEAEAGESGGRENHKQTSPLTQLGLQGRARGGGTQRPTFGTETGTSAYIPKRCCAAGAGACCAAPPPIGIDAKALADWTSMAFAGIWKPGTAPCGRLGTRP